MEETNKNIEDRISLLKEARLQLLRLHKLLVDTERGNYEKLNGQVSSGQFLNLLLSDKNFEWLRKFSMLIVEIDEMFDLDDGFAPNMIEKHLSAMSELLNLNTSDNEFNEKYQDYIQNNSEVAAKHAELKQFLAEK